jgi:hypothetical protein
MVHRIALAEQVVLDYNLVLAELQHTMRAAAVAEVKALQILLLLEQEELPVIQLVHLIQAQVEVEEAVLLMVAMADLE